MTLPKITVPTTTVELQDKTFVIRPFLMSEEKLLLIASSSSNSNDIFEATKQIVNNCIISINDETNFDINKLYIYELEYLILQLRKISISSIVNVNIKPSGKECEYCNKERQYKIKLDDVKLDVPEVINKFLLTDTIGVCMHFPLVKDAKVFNSNDNLFNAVLTCIDYVYEVKNGTEEITYIKDVSKEESISFLESLNSTQFKLIQDFYDKVPTLKYELNLKCKKCAHEERYMLEGLDDFFI